MKDFHLKILAVIMIIFSIFGLSILPFLSIIVQYIDAVTGFSPGNGYHTNNMDYLFESPLVYIGGFFVFSIILAVIYLIYRMMLRWQLRGKTSAGEESHRTVSEMTVHGNLKDVIQNTDTRLKEGKHRLDLRDEYNMTSQGMDVTVRIYQRYNFITANATCITLIFQDKKDGDIKIAWLSAGDEYGILGMDLGMGARTAQACGEKLKGMDKA